ncbi:MAG TPA: neutral zinc metallopeptidase [Acidimicrobiia bacterium]|nr:neutral zinc metallopeptidase [Acidimicrobiia bacterium]
MNETTPPTRRERRQATTRQRRLLTLVVAPIAIAVLAVSTMGAAPSGGNTPFSASADETIADLQQYWATTMPDVYGQQYESIPADRQFPYSSSNPPPGCGTRGNTPYSEVAGNAFYCSQGDFIAWDTEQLFPKLSQQFGPFAPALVLAHEWGHAIQARVGFDSSQTIYLEQQADCFAGSWAAHVASGDSSLSLSDDDLDRALAGMLQLSDPVGIDGSQDGAHGNGFDRVSAFQDGVEGGAAACAAYANDPPSITESAFTSQADYASGGDMALDELVPAIEKALDGYWSDAVGTKTSAPTLVSSTSTSAGASSCDGGTDGGVLVDSVTYCPSSNTIVYDPATLREANSSVGDFGAALLLATEWSSAVQHDLGDAVDTSAARRTSTCMTGAFTGSLDGSRRSSRTDGITLSPGDLDEVVSMLVGVKAGDDRGRAFDRVAAFRVGYTKGVTACTKL